MKSTIQKKSPRTFSYLLLLLIFCLFSLTSCKSNPRNFTVGKVTITLTEDFKKSSLNNFDVYLESEHVVFSAMEETKNSLEYSGYEINSLNDYCQAIMDLNSFFSKDLLESRDNYNYFVSTKTVSGAKYTYVHCMFETPTSYWICEFVSKTKDFDDLENYIFDWADSIQIAN